MKRYKTFNTIDLLVQSLLLLMIIIYSFTPSRFFKILVFVAIIGGWQFIIAIICAWSLKDKKRYLYLIIVILLYGILLPIIAIYHPSSLDKNSINTPSVIYSIFNPALIGICYYIITWRDFIKIRNTELG